jgi:hypothetical protein
MVRKSEMYKFFTDNKLYDNITSYVASYNISNNKYMYYNIARLINYCAEEYIKGTDEDANWEENNPDWNKVVLIPITINSDESTGSVVSISHCHDLTSARLVGGESSPITISIISSKFNNE